MLSSAGDRLCGGLTRAATGCSWQPCCLRHWSRGWHRPEYAGRETWPLSISPCLVCHGTEAGSAARAEGQDETTPTAACRLTASSGVIVLGLEPERGK